LQPDAGLPPRIAAVTPPDTVTYDGADLDTLLVLRRYRQWVLDELQPYLGGRAAEIGAGIGAYSADLLQRTSTLDLIEPSAAQHNRLVDRFAQESRVRVLNSTAEQWAASADPGSYDSVVMINVMEHVADDTALMNEVYRALRPGGRLLLFVPALMVLYSTLDRLVGHHRRYSRNELMRKSGSAGFQVQRCRYFDLLGTIPWFIVNRLGGATEFNLAAARLYDTVGVPLTRSLERLFPPPFGKNLIFIARKA
jgi:SAM-dependent methyltransferase